METEVSVEQLTSCSQRDRFVAELEFVQALSNPNYLNWLAQNQLLEDPAFQHYLTYLQYWKRPEYAKYLIYPQCLFFLELLKDSEFCKAIARPSIAEFIHTQQYNFWSHYWETRASEGTGS